MKTLTLLNGVAAAVAAAVVLIAADGALAKGNGDHGHGQDHSDHSQMKSQSFKSDHSDKHSEKNKDKSGDMRADKHKDKDSEHAEKMKDKDDDKHAEKTKDKDKDKTATTTTTGGKPAPTPTNGATPTPAAPGATPGPAAVNTIHPIMSPPPAPGTGGTNTIHPIISPPPAPTGSGKGIVTVSDGQGNSVIIPDHGTGVTVTPAGPGHVTISNGVDSRTVGAIKVNISGASAVAVDKSLGTGPRQADGSTVVLTPNGTVTGGPEGGSVFLGIGAAIANEFGMGGFKASSDGQHYP